VALFSFNDRFLAANSWNIPTRFYELTVLTHLRCRSPDAVPRADKTANGAALLVKSVDVNPSWGMAGERLFSQPRGNRRGCRGTWVGDNQGCYRLGDKKALPDR
jgi:hypothetical protein